MIAVTVHWDRYANAAKKTTRSNDVNEQRVRQKRSDNSKDYNASAIELTRLNCDYVRSLSAPTELSRRCRRPYGAVTATLLRFYCVFFQKVEPRHVVCAWSMCAPSHGVLQCFSGPTATNEDTVAMESLLRELQRFTLFKDAGGSH